jgi:hypothetical protein
MKRQNKAENEKEGVVDARARPALHKLDAALAGLASWHGQTHVLARLRAIILALSFFCSGCCCCRQNEQLKGVIRAGIWAFNAEEEVKRWFSSPVVKGWDNQRLRDDR